MSTQTERYTKFLELSTVVVDNLAGLKALDYGDYNYVWVEGFYEPGDWGEPKLYKANPAADKNTHNGWASVDSTHAQTIGANAWYSSENSGAGGVYEREGIENQFYVSVKEAGAKGDDTNDDTTAIMAVINYLRANFDGGWVWFANGTYRCNLTMYQDFVFSGQNCRKTKLRAATDNHVIDFHISTESMKNAIIEHMYIGDAEAGFTASNGINIQATTNGYWADRITIQDVQLDDNANRGLSVVTGSFSTNTNFIQSLTVDKSRIQNNGGEGIFVEGKVIEAAFVDTFCSGNAKDDYATYDNWTITTNAAGDEVNRVRIYGCSGNHFEALSNGEQDGAVLSITGGEAIEIENCGWESGCIYLNGNGLSNTVIFNNTFGTNHLLDQFIWVHNCDHLLIDKNDFAGNRPRDIYFDAAVSRYHGIDIGSNLHAGGATPVVYSTDIHVVTNNKLYVHLNEIKADGEGGAADQIDYIYGWYDNDEIDSIPDGWEILVRWRNDAMTVSHGTGNVYLTGGTNYVLDSDTKCLILRKSTLMNGWIEVGRK